MIVTNFLKRHKITQKQYAKYIGYSEQGLGLALKNEKRQKVLYAGALRMVLERRGINLEVLLSSIS